MSCFSFVLLLCALTLTTQSVTAYDFGVVTEEYRLPAELDPEVLDSSVTEIWAAVYRPKKWWRGPFPLIVMLHGNHATCGRFLLSGIRQDDDITYTFSGTCPDGYVVVPNHKGYEYVAKPLARRGYIVVSINANRGINGNWGPNGDFGLNLARGRLALRHLTLLSQWNRGKLHTPKSLRRSLKRQIDFSRVGFMAHSRGGEGLRAAWQQLRDPGNPFKDKIGRISVKAIYEVGPVDGQTGRVLNQDGLAGMILIPSCDSDVYDLQGHKVFDRVFQSTTDLVERPKGTFTVIGANHNSYNTEWQESEAFGCDGAKALFQQQGPSAAQQATLKLSLIPFLDAYVRGFKFPGRIFDPAYPIPSSLAKITFYERGHLRAPPGANVKVIQKFSQLSLISDAGLKNKAEGVDVLHDASLLFEHEFNQRVARISWNTKRRKYYQITLAKGKGLDFRKVRALAFRIAIGCSPAICGSSIDNSPDIDIRVSLVDNSGKRSKDVKVNDFYPLRRPTGTSWYGPHSTLQTVDLPRRAFRRVNIRRITAIRFTIKSPNEGTIYLGSITTDKLPFRSLKFDFRSRGEGASSQEAPAAALEPSSDQIPPVPQVQSVPQSQPMVESMVTEVEEAQDLKNGTVRLMLASSIKFPITNSLPLLTIGKTVIAEGAVEKNTSKIFFPIQTDKFLGLPAGGKVSVSVGRARYDFKSLPKPASIISSTL